MRTVRALLHRIAGLFTRSRADAEFAAELESHIALHTADGIRAGLGPEEARRRALLRLGGVEAAREVYRDRAGIPQIDSFLRDFRCASRSLLKTPVVTFVAILSLALGIGANAAIFSVTNALLLRPLPIHNPEQLVSIFTLHPEDTTEKDLLSLAMLEAIRKEQKVFSVVFGWYGGALRTFEAGKAVFPGMVTEVTGNYFSALGVNPLLGRLIEPGDTAISGSDSAPVAVLNYRCWRDRFHGDPAVIGTVIRVNAHPLTIVGVTPPAFSGLIVDGGEDVTVPMGAIGDMDFRERSRLRLGVYGRLKPGVSLEQARAQLKAIWPSVLRASVPEGYAGARLSRFYVRRVDLESAAHGWSSLRKRLSGPLTFLMALVGIVLTIACVNLANVMLARAEARRHDLAVRTALGASRGRLVRQLLTESMLLSLAGAALGFGIAQWTSRLLMSAMWTGPVPLVLDATPDTRVLAFTIAVSMLTAVLFGLAPALRAARTDPADALRNNTRTVRGTGRNVGKLLIVGQVGLSMVVVLAAALFVRSLRNIETADPGFQRKGVLVMQLMAQPGRQPTSNRAAYYRELVDKIYRLPGVVATSFSVIGPVNRGESKEPVVAESSDLSPEQAAGDVVGPEFFHMIGMRVLAGREFTWSDGEAAPRVAVISQSLAWRLFPGGNAVGRYVIADPGVNQQRLEVVGVVNSASLWRIQHKEPIAIYYPLLQEGPTGAYLDIRSGGNASAISGAAAKIVEDMGHEYPLYINTLEERIARMTVDEHMIAWLSGFFGGLALLLACIGLYGLMSDSVARRRPEIGLRMALGAERGNVVRMVLREALVLVGAGILIGIPAALAVSRSIGGMLFDVSSADPQTIALAGAALFGVGVFAAYLPARQASRIDPMATLKVD